ncbi:MAG: hypothetical protein LC677_01930 [Halomonas sp.]|nr:hypothetical protein [Halomonas sp.]
MKITFTLLTIMLAGLSSHAIADKHSDEQHDDEALVILTSDSLETQGMVMILANAMQQQGADLDILLCDAAGNLAVEDYESPNAITTPPSNPAGQVKPEGILKMLMENGANVDVCAIYLPNSEYDENNLLEGVGVATPEKIGQKMLDPNIHVHSF